MFTRTWSRYVPESSVGRPSFVAEYGLWNEAQTLAAEQIEAELGRLDLVRVVYADIHGLARSKTLSPEAFRMVLRNGMDFSPGPFVFDTGHAVAITFTEDDADVRVPEIVGAGDFVLVPDPLTFQTLPAPAGSTAGDHPRTGWVLGEEFLRDGTPHPLGSRGVLRRVCERYAAQDLLPLIGLELEWYVTKLLDDDPGNAGNGFGRQGTPPRVRAMNAGYQFNLDGYSDSLADVTGPLAVALMSMGLPLRSFEHESGPGQVETTFGPMAALDAADALLLFRTFTKQTCARRGLHASFMALPGLDSFDPSGWHLHQSAVNTKNGSNVLAPAADAAPGDGLSPEGERYVEGLVAHSAQLCLLSVPTVNGYRRISPEFSLSPSRPDVSPENRTAMVRVLGGGGSTHVENRIAEPSANPYLAIAAQLFAGLEGMTGTASGGSGAPALPRTLGEGLRAFQDGEAGAALLGGPLAACLAKLKRSEQGRFEDWCTEQGVPTDLLPDQVTDWEQREYFRVY